MGVYSEISIKVGDKFIEEYLSFSLHQEMLKPHVLIIRIRKDQIEQEPGFFDQSKKLIGKPVRITNKSLFKESNEFTGLVHHVRNILSHEHDGDLVELHASSPDIQMKDVNHYFSYENIFLDALVKKIVDRYAIAAKDIKPKNNPQLKYVVQYNENGFDFLKRQAIRFGEWFFYDGKTLRFGSLPQKTIKLEFGKDLHELEYGQHLNSFFYKYVGHDYELDRHVSIDSAIANRRIPTFSKHAFDESKQVYTHAANHYFHGSIPGKTNYQQLHEVTHLSKASAISQLMFCRGKTDHAGMSLGCTIEMENDSKTRNGRFVVVELEHHSDINGHYYNEFVAIPSDTEVPHYTNPEIQCFATPQSAEVIANNDPKGMGRIKVSFYWGQMHGLQTPWIRLLTAHGGSDKGIHFLPEIGEEVLIGFEGNNPDRPYVAGSLYNGKNKPLPRWRSQNNDFKSLRTRSGHTIEIIDKAGQEEIRIYDKEFNNYNYAITLASHSKQILIEAKGDMEIKADNLKINVNKEIEVKASNIKHKASSNIDISANDSINISASNNASIKTNNKMTLNGGVSLEQKASGSVVIDGGLKLEQKGAIVKIN